MKAFFDLQSLECSAIDIQRPIDRGQKQLLGRFVTLRAIFYVKIILFRKTLLNFSYFF